MDTENYNNWQLIMLDYYDQSDSANGIVDEPLKFIDWLRSNYKAPKLNQNKDESKN